MLLNNKIDIIFHIFLIISFVVHFGYLTYFMCNPKLPTIQIYDKHLKDIEFPLSFRFCVHQKNESTRYQRFGYDNEYDFFSGKSMFNGSIIGWAGHKEDGSTHGSVKGEI